MAAHGERLPKKAESLSSSPTAFGCAQKAQLVAGLRQQYPFMALLQVAGLPRSTFYYQQKVLAVADKYKKIKAHIRRLYDRHKGRYGYRRITAALRQAGTAVNHKTVQRLMQTLGLKSLVRPKKYRSYKGEVGEIAPNLLERKFDAAAANLKWVTDVTEFNVASQKLYLSPIMDLFNREIIAFETSRQPDFKMVAGMLKKSFAKLSENDKPVLHSDQGMLYQTATYQRLLRERQVTQSMSRKGNCIDNAAMESFFAVLKTEYFYLNKFTSVEQLNVGLKKYISYYNHKRIKLKLNGLSPVQYRRLMNV